MTPSDADAHPLWGQQQRAPGLRQPGQVAKVGVDAVRGTAAHEDQPLGVLRHQGLATVPMG